MIMSDVSMNWQHICDVFVNVGMSECEMESRVVCGQCDEKWTEQTAKTCVIEYDDDVILNNW